MKHIKTVLLLGLLSGLLIAISTLLFGGTYGSIIGLGMAAVMNFSSWFFSDKIALSAYNAQPVGPETAPGVYRIVQRLSQRANLPMPQVYVVPSNGLNAFATGRDPAHAAVAVTEGLVRFLPEDELEGVIAHELTHIANRDTLTQAVAATVGGAIAYLGQMASYSMFFFGGSRNENNGPNPIGLLVTIFVAPLAATIIQLGISRTREFAADEGAARLTGNPQALARALQRLESSAAQQPLEASPAFAPLLIINPLPRNLLRSLFSTHPATEDRVQRLLALDHQLGSSRSRFVRG
ncbi:MAG: M48 family metalloprotease [Thermosynechococcaceae cyanobacterium MS004]|nr:M48 family metalloprotease [Thermosynechococcaceae cyanobacterium MS004]